MSSRYLHTTRKCHSRNKKSNVVLKHRYSSRVGCMYSSIWRYKRTSWYGCHSSRRETEQLCLWARSECFHNRRHASSRGFWFGKKICKQWRWAEKKTKKCWISWVLKVGITEHSSLPSSVAQSSHWPIIKIRYASINAHKGKDLSRRDDMWCLFYMILEMLGAMLPWHHLLKNKTPESKQKIFKMKLSLHTNLHKYFWIDSNRNIPCL